MATGNKLIFANAEQVRDAITESQKKEIASLYQQWADEIGERAKYYSHKSTASAPVSERQMRELEKQLRETSQQVSNEIYNKIKENMYTVADAVIKDNVEWLKQFGFSEEGLNAAFTSVPDSIVRRIVTGGIYEGGWNLSSKIWSNNEATLKQCYQIVAGGMAKNQSIYEIAKQLQGYVQPGAAKSWNPLIAMRNTKTGQIEYKRIYRGKVDYNAQRLARTLVQHGYQQSFIATTEKNPFVLKYVWYANGSRPCPLCMDRDGQEFAKGDLPMDHPNGQCTMAPVVDDKMLDQLADWFNSPGGTYPEIDEYAKGFGYVPPKAPASQSTLQDKWFSAAGYKPGEVPQSFTEFAHKLSYDQQSELLKEAGGNWSMAHPFQTMEKYYNETIMAASNPAAGTGVNPAAVLGTSKGKTFNYWYTKLDDTQKALAKQLKEQSGLTWQQWYEQNIYTGAKGTAGKAAAATGSQARQFGGANFDPNAWLSKIRGQTESEMLQTEARSLAGMTNKQSAGLVKYTGSSYNEMNGYLRYRAGGMSHEDAVRASGISPGQLSAMKEAMAGLSKTGFERDFVLRRGTSLGDLAGLMPGDYQANKQALRNMTIEELNQRLAGTTGTYAGFTSTSSLWDRGFTGDVEIVFWAPKGAAGSSIMSISQFGTGEGETLLNAGTEVKIHKIEASDGHKGSSIRVWMEIIGNK